MLKLTHKFCYRANFTKQAEEHNVENLLVIEDSAIAGKFTTNWKIHFAHSKPYQRK